MMKRVTFSLIFAVLCFGPVSSQTENRYANEPIQHLIQTSLDANAKLFEHHREVSTYLNAYLGIWRPLLSQLFTQDATEIHLESFFDQNVQLMKPALPAFGKLKVPSEFKDFQEVFLKGLEELSNWCLDMRERVHFAKTPYQKDAYMKRLQGFQQDWYSTFFGDSLDELNNAMSIFLTSHWMDELSPEQAKALKANPDVKRYLTAYHRINGSHFKEVQKISKQVREDRAKEKGDDPATYIKNLQSEFDDLSKALTNLKKITPPKSFAEFHAGEIAWLDAHARTTQILIEIEKANVKHLPDEKIQALVYEKNQIEAESGQLKARADKAYEDALKSL